ncbi:uncharacterized protein C2orf50 homolog isoform X1 [Polypterus senegalus]|uniref:uncharacterized protein C2orf50 homolog isoform X1 n=1 Tax=Polypterus senegalus TaxID=55291 RepID=UPI0019641FF9|nr:uncharacterized protein C2orf50 homolog isoform X1 [Polypterus senegalus]
MGRLRRTTSAGYRVPSKPVAALTSNSAVSVSSSRKPKETGSGTPGGHRGGEDVDKQDTVKEDRVWRESVHAEQRGVQQWERNWSFLKDFDQLGRPREEEHLPEYVSFYSEKVPNTMNQNIGSRMNTEIGQALIRMDLLLQHGHRRKKLHEELMPC